MFMFPTSNCIAMNDNRWIHEWKNEWINNCFNFRAGFECMAGPTLFTLLMTELLNEAEGILSLFTWPWLEKHDKQGV